MTPRDPLAPLRRMQGPIDTARGRLDELLERRAALWRRLVEDGTSVAAVAEASGVTPAAVRLRLRKPEPQ